MLINAVIECELQQLDMMFNHAAEPSCVYASYARRDASDVCLQPGEHKIMDFIRRQRAQPDHDPNTHHCLCGADADLIMLGLATHEPQFTIIREEFKPNKPKNCEICGQVGQYYVGM